MKAVNFVVKNKEIIPVLACVGFACVMATGFLARSAVRYPDVAINKKNNPAPWLKIKPDEQVKLLSPTQDYSKLKSDRPNIDD